MFVIDTNALNLYLLKEVIITFANGRFINGVLSNVVSTTQEIMLDNTLYPVSSISDIEMVGSITYHTYSEDMMSAYDINGLYFPVDNFVSGSDYSKLLHGEFDCVGACHLSFENSRICAKDIRILSFAHRVYIPALTNNTYLYISDNSCIVGILIHSDTSSIRKADGSIVPIDLGTVRDIIRLPLTNEAVEIILRNKEVISGVVSAANESIVVIIGECVHTIQISDIVSIRYSGVISATNIRLSSGMVKQIRLSLGVKDESFLCKIPYFHSTEDEELGIDGAKASFIPGVTERGLIAKDVIIESKAPSEVSKEYKTGLVIIAPSPNRNMGYIGNEYLTKTYALLTNSSMPRGNISFTADQLHFSVNPRRVYVVRYLCDDNENQSRAQTIEMVESYPLSEYAKFWIDEMGSVQMLPVSVLFLEKFFNQHVSIETTDKSSVSGVVSEVTDNEVSLSNDTEEGTKIGFAHIRRVYFFGKVTAYQANNGTGFINGQYWFHVNSFVDRNQILQLEIGSSVKFSFEVSNKGNLCAASCIEIVDNPEQTGYVLKYIVRGSKSFGFIIPSELLQDRLERNDRSGTIYFKESDIENPEEFRTIDTSKYYYSVTYTKGEGAIAHNVKFLGTHLFRMPVPKPVPKPVKTRKETRLISDLAMPAGALAGENYTYGLINYFTAKNALINTQFFNRTYSSDGTYDSRQTVTFDPEEITIIPEPRINTGNYCYLVRYVRKSETTDPTTEQVQPTIDASRPVEVVYSFSKSQCASIVIEEDRLIIEYVEESKKERVYNEAPDVMLGESLYFELADGSVCCGVVSGETDSSYSLSDSKEIKKSDVSRLFRFGIVSALNLNNGTITINNHFDVSMNVAESKMVSILKNQKNLIRLHIIYSCVDGKITEVCRVSKRCLSCLPWSPGTVTELNSKSHSITINSTIVHYLTVLSDGINAFVNNGTVLDRAVYVKQVAHPYLGEKDAEPGIVDSAVDVRCQEEELKIQYDEGKDVYMGYRNATVFFPVYGSEPFLHDRIGETILVTFRMSTDLCNLEGYADDNTDEPAAELFEPSDTSQIQRESLSLLLLQREDADQSTAGKYSLSPDADQAQVQRVVDFLISKSTHLAAIKVATAYPAFDVLPNLETMFRTEIQKRCTAVELDTNSYLGEQAYYAVIALQYPTSSKARGRVSGSRFSADDYLYRLFVLDFEGRECLVKYLQSGQPARKANLVNLFGKSCLQISEFVAHIVLLNQLNLETVCGMIRKNHSLSEGILSYAKEVDELISTADIADVIHSLQDRYLRDKRRFTDGIIRLIDGDNACSDLKNLLVNMQSRFLKLICEDDRRRFEALLKICTDVLDYANVPGFTQQEQLLLHAYREVELLEEDILTHPCKESVEMLMSSGQFDASQNILLSVKQNIFSLLNILYADASKPRIEVTLNETSILPQSHTFWIIIENGSRNANLQPAENFQLELESFTQGFAPQAHVHFKQNKLVCGEQVAAEVTFELSKEAAGVLEFGWTARYAYTTEFQSNGSTKKTTVVQESDHPLQLQINSAFAERKNYDADNPYLDPARGQPLVGKEMFFGRQLEKQTIINAICSTNGSKQFIPGSAVIIHGQKKSGKTSLVNQVKNFIKDDGELSDKAILLNFSNILSEMGGVQQLEFFQRTFYAAIMSRFKHEIKRCHPDIAQMLRENEISIPNLLLPDYRETWPAAFDAFFQEFHSVDNGKHTVLLFMDEFTLLCTTILSEMQRFPEKASLNNIPNFIKTFSQYGFIQIIIGHEAMMRALNTLGVLNHTAEFAKSIEISALDDEAARDLIKLPMADRFGYNVYDSALGEQAVDRLLDLSGRNPAYLMRLCNQMFLYFTNPNKCARTQLLLSDVNSMVRDYTGELLLSDFDILLMEDGDDAMEAEKRITYRYLKTAALLSLSSYDRRTADSSEITRELTRNYDYTTEEIEKARNILEARRVISNTNGGRVKINTGLFSEFIIQKNGLR